jgi:hypothetical protein
VIWGEDELSKVFIHLALDAGKWSASGPSCFTSVDRATIIQWTSGWMSPTANADAVNERKIPVPQNES